MIIGGGSDQARVEQQIVVTASQKPAATDRFSGERQLPFLIHIVQQLRQHRRLAIDGAGNREFAPGQLRQTGKK